MRILLILTLFFVAQVNAVKADFVASDFETVKLRAQSSNTSIIAYFHGSYCGACKWMERNTFKNDNIKQQLDNDFYFVKIDIESFDGVNYGIEYDITVLPTFLVIDPDGHVSQKVEEALSVEKMATLLNEAKKLNKPSIQEEVIPMSPIGYNKPVIAPIKIETVEPTIEIIKPVVEESFIVEEKIETQQSLFLIQYGVYSTEGAAKLKQRNMSTHFGEQSTIVTKRINGKKMFCVINDSFYSKEMIETHTFKLKQKNYNRFIVKKK